MESQTKSNKVVHLVAGGVAGTVSSAATCPLDVAKTRLQSSLIAAGRMQVRPTFNVAGGGYAATLHASLSQPRRPTVSIGFYHCIRHIVRTEGVRALFKGLGPTLIGIAPSRSIYFATYAHCKSVFHDVIHPVSKAQHSLVHLCSAASAAFVTTTFTNPVWMVRTRLQLDQKRDGSLTALQCIRQVYRQEGIRGFYRGLTASYYGIVETAIHFVIYERLRAKLVELRARRRPRDSETSAAGRVWDFIEYMAAAGTSKGIATCVGYPHEVARTRMREEGSRYRRFWQTLWKVASDEGVRGVYRGLTTQLIKHIPNTAIMMSTYEAVVYLCRRHGF